jgi:glucosyl-3-phosphoglycerate synthase
MSDFHQSGPVTSLPRLLSRPIEDLEERILGLVRRFPVALVIPMVPEEMDRPALSRIVAELADVDYLDTLVVSLNHATAEDHARALEFFAPYEGRKVVLWNEAPPVKEFVDEIGAAGLYTGEPGKGRACWLAMGHVLAW